MNFNDDSKKLLMRESIILHKLNHPCIVSFKDINFQSFTDLSKLEPSIITEYVKQGSLKTILNKEKVSLSNPEWTATTKYITLIPISNAMRYLHAHSIVHRDLKPENVLMYMLHRPRDCDFGLSWYFPTSHTKSSKLTIAHGSRISAWKRPLRSEY